ncbi:sigma factor-like helix-turn-helix DNA-binding protein [Sphingomonas sp. Sphisp140]|uniref:sigma factor-like helix-turn-helix DNA-binding protein n=1 Tax=unclassified Sphingomonas TaxID=196159 RepID=UPI0039B05306
MSKTTIALEAAVAIVLENTPKDVPQTNRQRVTVDRAFAQILKLIAPRIRHFVRQYGLTAHWEDAEQVCAIAVHRAIEGYDPTKAQFTTFVNWQIRGELQSLRFRLMTDQRPSAKKVEATTVSLSALATSPDGDEISPEAMIEDEYALARTEAAASDYLAEGAVSELIDAYVDQLRKVGVEALRRRPRAKKADAPVRREGPFKTVDPVALEQLEAKLIRDRQIVERRLFDSATLDEVSNDTGVTKERIRQITKQATKLLTEIAAETPRFEMMADDARRAMPPARPRRSIAAAKQVSLLPDPSALHNRLSHIEAIEAERMAYVTPALPVAQLVMH